MPNGNGSKSKKRKAAAEGKRQKKKKKSPSSFADASHDAAVRKAVADAAASHVASHDASRTTSAAEVRRARYDPNADAEAWRAVLDPVAAGRRLLEKVDVYRVELPETDAKNLEDLVFNKLRPRRGKNPPRLSCTKVTEDSDSPVIELLGRSFVATDAGNPVAALFAADVAELRENGAPEDLYGSKMMRRYERRSRLAHAAIECEIDFKLYPPSRARTSLPTATDLSIDVICA
jgi:hypothetical protein